MVLVPTLNSVWVPEITEDSQGRPTISFRNAGTDEVIGTPVGFEVLPGDGKIRGFYIGLNPAQAQEFFVADPSGRLVFG